MDQEHAIRYVAIVDGEHYPPVIEDALRELQRTRGEIVCAVLAGGTEKLPTGGLELGEFAVVAGGAPENLLGQVIDDVRPDAIIDLSDEPVLDARRRHRLAALALERGVRYEGADFVFRPPPRPRLARIPSVAVVSTGKRTGKTAVAGHAARTLTGAGWGPVIVAMGRGGPAEPEVLHGDAVELGPSDLLALAAAGKHGASDYVEDALLARVPTVGCRRCGGGLAGAVEISNVPQGVEVANRLGGDLCILEGSGSALPPVHADATVLVVPAHVPTEYVTGYFGPYRLLLSDLVVITMAEQPFGSASRVSSLDRCIQETVAAMPGVRGSREAVEVVHTVFRPAPTRPIDGASVCVATTAPEATRDVIMTYLEQEHGCRVTGVTHALSQRARLDAELEQMLKEADVLLCEIKAAAVDVATRRALDAGADVVYMANVPIGADGHDVDGALLRVADIARERFEAAGLMEGAT